MKCEVLAIGTELLLGQIVDTNSSWIGEQLAQSGIDSHFQTKVGDNLDRIIGALRLALDRSDAVIVCGGLGPTPDDITREAIAAVMGVELRRNTEVAERIRKRFAVRDRPMPANNYRQADVPVGATVMSVQPGTAPGLVCPVGSKVIYAVPGVPWEMKRMVSQCVLDDLRARSGTTSVIASRTLRTWGHSESGLAEVLDDEIRRLDEAGEATIAFLASGWEGLKVRITAKASDEETVQRVLAEQERRVRDLIGDVVFGVDDDTMESVTLELLNDRGLTLALAESVTGGLIAARLTNVAGASRALRGSVVPYHRDIKERFLEVPRPPVSVVSGEMALAMAEGVCHKLGSDIGLATTGVAGPDPHEGVEPGTVWVGLWFASGFEPPQSPRGDNGGNTLWVTGQHQEALGRAQKLTFPFDRDRIRQFTTITALNLLRTTLLSN